MERFAELARAPAVPEVWTGGIVVDPARARQWLTECAYAGQRRLNEHRTRLYSGEMTGGLWRLSELRFARLPDGHAYLMNGYTRLNAILTSGQSVPFTVTVVDVQTLGDVASEYATLDTQRVRQTKDLLRGHELEEHVGFPLTDQERVARTAGIVSSGFSRSSSLAFARTIQFRLPFLLEWAPFARVVFSAMHTGHVLDPPALRITNAPIFAVALVVARFQPEKAQQFFGAIVENDGLRRGQPDWILRDYLARLSTATVRDYPAMERRVAACWNAFMEERPMAFARAEPNPDGEWAPIKLVGTPYTGQQTIRLYGGGLMVPGSEPEGMRAAEIYRAAEQADAEQQQTHRQVAR